jgi:hypothetical protein
MSTDWEEEEERWSNGIDLTTTASKEDLTSFITYKLWEYERDKIKDNYLWSSFTNDFEYFKIDNFALAGALITRELHGFLRQRGVYVAYKEKRTTYAQLLFDAVQEEKEHKWTEEEIETVQEQFHDEGLKSSRLAYWIHKNSIGLAKGLVKSAQPAQLAQAQPVEPAQPFHPSFLSQTQAAQSTQQQHQQQHSASGSQQSQSQPQPQPDPTTHTPTTLTQQSQPQPPYAVSGSRPIISTQDPPPHIPRQATQQPQPDPTAHTPTQVTQQPPQHPASGSQQPQPQHPASGSQQPQSQYPASDSQPAQAQSAQAVQPAQPAQAAQPAQPRIAAEEHTTTSPEHHTTSNKTSLEPHFTTYEISSEPHITTNLRLPTPPSISTQDPPVHTPRQATGWGKETASSAKIFIEELSEVRTVDASSVNTGNASNDIDHYFASFGQVFCHLLTAQDITTTPIDGQNSFSHTSTISCYTADNFLGIMIDAG